MVAQDDDRWERRDAATVLLRLGLAEVGCVWGGGDNRLLVLLFIRTA